MTPPPTAYERGRVQGDEALRSSLLDVAGALLAEQGSEALTMRRLADAAGCSTAVLYRLFDGKQGIVRGLYREGFDRLRRRLAAVPPDPDELVRLGELAVAYREHAVEEPAYYSVMFARPVPQFDPSPADVAHARASLQHLVDAVAEAQAADRLLGDDPAKVAEVLWAAAHGAISLELAGHLDASTGRRVFSDLTAAAAARFVPDPR